MSPHRRRGFALLAVLWVMAAVTVLGTGLALVARRAVRSATNRRETLVAEWSAEGCVARSRAALELALEQDSVRRAAPGAAWATMDRTLAASPLVLDAGCHVSLAPTGRAIDVNAADGDELARLFAAVGIPTPRADSMVDALLDWRDADDVPRANGAESAWYRAHGRALPRNGPLANVAELGRVRGFEAMGGMDTLLTTEPGRIVLNRAPPAVLAALPGFGPEAIGRMEEYRGRGRPVPSLLVLSGELSRAARAALIARYADLERLTTPEPDAWLLTSRAQVGVPAITVVVEVKLVRAGTRAAVVGRRTWLE